MFSWFGMAPKGRSRRRRLCWRGWIISRKTVVDGWVKPSCTDRRLEDGDKHICEDHRAWLSKTELHEFLSEVGDVARMLCEVD